MSELQPIETRYRGHRFRSRLEARWAVFFDSLGLRWQYEPEAFKLPSGPYLPDFRLHVSMCGRNQVWVEVKGKYNDGDLSRLLELSQATDTPGLILVEEVGNGQGLHTALTSGYDWGYVFAKCDSCGAVVVEFPDSSYMTCKCGGNLKPDHHGICNAVDEARAARFGVHE
jgi:hypothetical protein